MDASIPDAFHDIDEDDASLCSKYCDKIRGGVQEQSPRRYNAFFSSTLGTILIFSLLVITKHSDFPLIASSFAASTVLLSVSPQAPYSQPRNVIVGHTIGAVLGCSIRKISLSIPLAYVYEPVVGALSVGTTIYVTDVMHVVHPPAAATAMVATIDAFHSEKHAFMFVLRPILLGSVILVFCTCLISNLSNSRSYPAYW